MGVWLGAAALAVQLLLPLILVFDLHGLASGHEDHAAAYRHLRSPEPAVQDHPGKESGHVHSACPVCLVLHAGGDILAPPIMAPQSLPARRHADSADSSASLRVSDPVASYLSRAPPGLAESLAFPREFPAVPMAA